MLLIALPPSRPANLLSLNCPFQPANFLSTTYNTFRSQFTGEKGLRSELQHGDTSLVPPSPRRPVSASFHPYSILNGIVAVRRQHRCPGSGQTCQRDRIAFESSARKDDARSASDSGTGDRGCLH